jgi:hypothetical protein
MAGIANKTKATAQATATPRQASAKNMKVAEVAKPTTSVRKGIEIVAKIPEPKKAETASAKLNKTVTKKESNSQPKVVSREKIEQIAYQIWVQLGYRHGHALEDWIMAERALLERAS